HIERFRRALLLLNVADPDTVIADRLSGQGPFVATDPFMAPESFGEPEEPLLQPLLDAEPEARHSPRVQEPEPPAPPIEEPPPPREEPPKPPARAAEPDIPLRPRAVAPPPAPPETPAPQQKKPSTKTSGFDIDLTNVLEELEGIGAAPPAARRPP